METVLWEVNGEVRKKDERLLKEFLEKGDYQDYLVVHEEGDQFGHFRDVVYAVPRKHGVTIFVERVWIPAHGYAWSEIQIKRIEVR